MEPPRKRSLILAGGGLKVAYQAGCLQAFDEAGLRFDHVDAASGGCFNAAMMASGMTGTEIANHWRTMDPRAFTSLDWRNYYKLIWNRSVGTSDGMKHIFRDVWKLDFKQINTDGPTCYTFNHFDFTTKRVVVVENTALDANTLLACVSLMMWVPSVQDRGGNWKFDAVWRTDGNVGEAVSRGAAEIWAIWTVSDTPELRDGFVAQYFHLIETVADAQFKEDWREIKMVNELIRKNDGPIPGPSPDLRLRSGFDRTVIANQPPPPGRISIEQHLIRQEVPMHYLLVFNRDRVAAAVEMGVRDARCHLRKYGLIPESRSFAAVQPGRPTPPSIEFCERMRGFFMPGEVDPATGAARGRCAGNALTVDLTIATLDLDTFLHQPEHLATATGRVDCPLLCGEPMPVTTGSFALFVNNRKGGTVQPGRKRMLYELEFEDRNGTRFKLTGEKRVYDGNGFTLWPDTTTLYVRISTKRPGPADWSPYGAGIIHVLPGDFLKELTTFRVRGRGGVGAKAQALGRFGTFWAGQAWDVYLRGLVDYAPF